MAIEPMRHEGFLLARRPRRDDTQIAVYLHRIGIDNRAAQLFGKRQSQYRFTATSRARNKNDAWLLRDGRLLGEFIQSEAFRRGGCMTNYG